VGAAKYRTIAAALLARIAAREFRPGDAIPNEADLAAEYGVARPTVARALASLVAQGLIERRRRAGSRVAVRAAVAARLFIPLAREEIAATGAAYGHRLLARETTPPPAEVAALFGLAPGRPALRTASLHLADGAPWQLERRWINLAAAPEAAAAPFEAVSPNEWLVRHAPYTSIAHDVWAAAADGPTAAALDAPTGAPVLVVERSSWLGARAVTRVRMINRGPDYRLRFRAPD